MSRSKTTISTVEDVPGFLYICGRCGKCESVPEWTDSGQPYHWCSVHQREEIRYFCKECSRELGIGY